MPTIQYPNHPNTDTAFVVQDDGTKNRALMTAPQDTSTLELPKNANSCKGYVTINGKKQRVVMTADVMGGGSGDQHNLGWYATQAALEEAHPTAEAGDWAIVGSTDTVWIWDTDNEEWVDSDQKGQVTSVNGQTGAVTVSEIPSQTGNAGKFLTTDGTDASWSDKPLVNNTTALNSLAIGAGSITSANCCACGIDAKATGSYTLAIGYNSNAGWNSSIAIGSNANTGAAGAIQISSRFTPTTNSDANTFKVANNNGNFELMSADGTIPTARLTKVNTTITLTAAGWSNGSQTVSVSGITSTGVVFVSPDPTDQTDYTTAGIICTAQATDSLTFTCDTTPSSDIDVVVVQM